MKKTILTIGLFTVVLASTSFATPTISTSPIADNAVIASIGGNGNQDSGGHKKEDFARNKTTKTATMRMKEIDGKGGQDSGGRRKED